MNTQNTSREERPFGYWLTATDRLLAAEFARAFENEGITRRDWRLLNAVDGSVPTGRPIDDRKLGRLIELGWISSAEDAWELTDDGRAAKERLGAIVDGIRATVAGAVSPEDYATTIASLTAIARALGWDENAPLPRRRRGHEGRRRHGGHSRRHAHGFGPFAGHRAPDDHDHDHDGHGHRHGRRFGEHAGPHCREHVEAHEALGGHRRGPGSAPREFDGGGSRFADHGSGRWHGDHGHDRSSRDDLHGTRNGSWHSDGAPADHGHGRGYGGHAASDQHFGAHGDHGHSAHDDGRGRHGHGGPHRRIARMAQHAYERGFDAGFERGTTAG
ncbi:hypothetical protein M2317_001790 [Microbacterium sp. ZKA21]|uniref:MarR family winged helix-turn-helix transcriptional regulator n=1 Tax=Microbacterium sp. ZKA21 TaxID=3381694 RepID=UPI003D231567